MGSIKKILPPQPHYLSGYAGYVPGYKFYYGQSYGKLTHDLFFDKTINRSNIPVLSDLTNVHDDTFFTPEEMDSINKRCETRSCKYTTNIIPGYAGYVPQYNFLCGNKFTVDATLGMTNFVKIQNSCLCPQCEQTQGYSKKFDKNIKDVNKYTHPFKKNVDGVKLFKEQYEPTLPSPPSLTPYFLENGNPHKKFMVGYAGHVPNLLFQFGQSYTPSTNDALNIFTDQLEKHKLNSI
ncbi:protein FAM166B [Aphis gossypii]|uniref:Ciliary microtubule inner protein 2A-C-like domain-containing protein n=1 Tax=Aphis gossypii TaxID=80765 RepID=A0A9P0IS22_APHGO|nr:protein FAM166B [Aphis gossypii]CAH1714399.1 unnamed protein product [Aphis gossypii]